MYLTQKKKKVWGGQNSRKVEKEKQSEMRVPDCRPHLLNTTSPRCIQGMIPIDRSEIIAWLNHRHRSAGGCSSRIASSCRRRSRHRRRTSCSAASSSRRHRSHRRHPADQ